MLSSTKHLVTNKRKEIFKQIGEKIEELQEDFQARQRKNYFSHFKSKRDQLIGKEIQHREALIAQYKSIQADPFYYRRQFIGDNPTYQAPSPDPLDLRAQWRQGKVSIDLKIEEDIQEIASKYGILPKEKIGDTVAYNQG